MGKRKLPVQKSESELQTDMIKYLQSKKIYNININPGRFMRAGIPDLICCVKGLFVAIEIKRPDGKGVTSALQEINIEQIKKSGGIAVVMDNYIEFTKFVDKLLECEVIKQWN